MVNRVKNGRWLLCIYCVFVEDIKKFTGHLHFLHTQHKLTNKYGWAMYFWYNLFSKSKKQIHVHYHIHVFYWRYTASYCALILYYINVSWHLLRLLKFRTRFTCNTHHDDVDLHALFFYFYNIYRKPEIMSKCVERWLFFYLETALWRQPALRWMVKEFVMFMWFFLYFTTAYFHPKDRYIIECH